MFPSLERAWVLNRRPPIDDVLREVVRRASAQVRRRLNAATAAMSDAELRGYVRARATRPVRIAAEELSTEQGWRSVLTDSLVASALERAVHQIVYQTRSQSVISPSAARATLRAVA
jgi:hypothetical protein